MGRKLTQEEAEKRSLDIGVRMVGKYRRSDIKTEFECPKCNNPFLTTPHSVWKKDGQRTSSCGCQRGVKNMLSQEEAEQNSLNAGIKMVGKYINSKTKVEFECPRCNTVFKTIPYSAWVGITRSCGCLNSELASKRNRSELAGQKFGNLTVLEYSHIAKDRHIVWRCECECGNTTNVSSTHLKGKRVKRCGKCKLKRNGITTSSKALDIHKLLKNKGIHNYKTCKKGRTYICIDIAYVLNGQKIAIEYDEWFWHGHKQKKDKLKLAKLRRKGWKTLQIKAGGDIPTQKQLEKAIYTLAYTEAQQRTITLPGWSKGPTRFNNE